MSISLRPLWFAVPAVLLLAGCGFVSDVAIGEPVEIVGGALTVTEVTQGTAEDVKDLDLGELEQHTPYFVRYQVGFDEGTPEDDQVVPTALWDGDATSGEVEPVEIWDLRRTFECGGLGEVAAGKAKGCQLLMVEPGATLEAVEYGGRGRWPVSGS